MIKKLLQNKLKITKVFFLIILFILVRTFETRLFYDPFLAFFKSEFQLLPLPNFDGFQLFWGMLLRYILNAIISLSLIYLIFKEIELVKFAALLYGIFFVILFIAFFSIIHFSGNTNNLLLFNVRRFLIQPLFVLLFIPAFYYQKKVKS
jgi:exosortase F-associated protein